MQNRCVFCGKELGLFQRKELACGGVNQTCCQDCHRTVGALPMEQRCRRALDSGRAENWQEVKKFLDEREQENQRREQELERRRTPRTCPRCAVPLFSLGRQTFKLGEETFFFSDWNRLASGSLDLVLEVCPQCRRVEFFLPDGISFDLNER